MQSSECQSTKYLLIYFLSYASFPFSFKSANIFTNDYLNFMLSLAYFLQYINCNQNWLVPDYILFAEFWYTAIAGLTKFMQKLLANAFSCLVILKLCPGEQKPSSKLNQIHEFDYLQKKYLDRLAFNSTCSLFESQSNTVNIDNGLEVIQECYELMSRQLIEVQRMYSCFKQLKPLTNPLVLRKKTVPQLLAVKLEISPKQHGSYTILSSISKTNSFSAWITRICLFVVVICLISPLKSLFCLLSTVQINLLADDLNERMQTLFEFSTWSTFPSERQYSRFIYSFIWGIFIVGNLGCYTNFVYPCCWVISQGFVLDNFAYCWAYQLSGMNLDGIILFFYLLFPSLFIIVDCSVFIITCFGLLFYSNLLYILTFESFYQFQFFMLISCCPKIQNFVFVIQLTPEAPQVAMIKLFFSYSFSFLPKSCILKLRITTYFLQTFANKISPYEFHQKPSIDSSAQPGEEAMTSGYLNALFLPILQIDRQPELSPTASTKVVSDPYSQTFGLNFTQLIGA